MTGPDGRVRLGRSSVWVTRLGMGCAPLGGLFSPVADEQAAATVRAAWDAGVRLFDTAPLYGSGVAERRLGAALAGLPRGELVVSTKVGRLLVPGPPDPLFADSAPLAPVFDFSADGVRRSLDASLERLGLDRVDVVLVHDPDHHEDEALNGAFPALLALRDDGVVGAVGVGMNQSAMPARFVTRLDLDVVLLAGRYTLLDQRGLDDLLPACEVRGTAVLAAGVLNSGVLADPHDTATFDYEPATPAVLARARQLRGACRRHGVSLAAAATCFPLGHPAVAAVVVGARTPAEIEAAAGALAGPPPAQLWDDLLAGGLLPGGVPLPAAGGERQ
jgi:D-threo-aldose 1-dehydrogenase